jgi:hypothetical protein
MTHDQPATNQQIYTVPPEPGDPEAATVEQPPYPAFSNDPVPDPLPDPVDNYVDDDEEWVSAAPRGLRVRIPTGVLLLLLFAAVGLWGGSILQKHRDKSTAASRTTGAAAAFAAGTGRRAGAAAGAGAGAAGAAAGGTTGGTSAGGAAARAGALAGIVTDIQGSTIYLTDASGNLIKIITTPASTVRKTDTGTLADIKPGQTVLVTGAKAADGSTTARSITISPAGGGGFGGFGGGGGGGGSGGAGAGGG